MRKIAGYLGLMRCRRLLDRRHLESTRRLQITVLSIGCGGVVGALGRYSLSLALPTQPGRFPWDTFVINLSGSLVLGFLLVLMIEQFPRGRLARPVIGTGILGAYTTFSTFSVGNAQLWRAGSALTSLSYIVGSVLGGLMAVWVGMTAARVAMRLERWLQESP